jgi:GDP-4-dehydro-6-deoxy-D-mannose reductase
MMTPKRVLITGTTGFVGSHLADFIVSKGGVEVFGIKRGRSRTENVKHLEGKISWVECDLRDGSSVHTMLKEVRPDWIFHLAAHSFVPSSWNAPQECFTTNVMGQLNLFQAVLEVGIDPSILVVGSSEEYGLVPQDELPIRETNPLRPLSPYAVSKVSQDLLGYQYFKSYGLKVVRTRAFNHTGPRRGEMFVESNFSKQIAEIEAGLQPAVIRVGNLDAIRDFTDVRDIVRGYWLALEKGEFGEVYNLCSGVGYAIHEVLDILKQHSEMAIATVEDPARLRPSDVPVLLGDCSKFQCATGWERQIPFEDTLAELLDYWRERVGAWSADPTVTAMSQGTWQA